MAFKYQLYTEHRNKVVTSKLITSLFFLYGCFSLLAQAFKKKILKKPLKVKEEILF